jgi:hypothetical protein
MTITNGYATLAEAKARLWPAGAPVDTTEDTALEAIIEAASRKIDGDTWRHFFTSAADETRYYKPLNHDCILPDDILSVTSLAIDTVLDGTYATALATTDFELLPYNAPLRGEPYNHIALRPMAQYGFPTGYKSVKIVGKFGYAAVAVSEAQVFTAPVTTFVGVDSLYSLGVGGLKTDDNNDGVFETTWTLTTDFTVTAIPGTATTLLSAVGAKTFPVTTNGVQVTATWNAAGAPKDVKEACLVQVLIMYQTKNMVGGMGKLNDTIESLEANYKRLISNYVRFV